MVLGYNDFIHAAPARINRINVNNVVLSIKIYGLQYVRLLAASGSTWKAQKK